jgi:subtilisin family serine protease
MRKHLLLVMLLLLTVNTYAQKTETFNGTHYYLNAKRLYSSNGFEVNTKIVTVRLKSRSIESNLFQKIGRVIRANPLGYIDIEVPEQYQLLDFAKILLKLPEIDLVELNTIGKYGDIKNKTNTLSIVPNDSNYPAQWYLSQINMPSAWDVTTGGTCITVAVLDSGTDWSHNDLGLGTDTYQNIYTNSLEDTWSDQNNPSSGNHMDNDSNGFIDDWKGWNFSSNSNDVRTSNFHGTHVAGIISAKSNNNIGITGIAGGNNGSGSKLLPVCIGVNAPDGSVIDDAIYYAVSKGAKVIQLSLSVEESSAINSAIQHAIDNNVTVVCAAGNENGSVSFPARNSNVISVGATNQNDQKASFSNFGSNLVIAAPGTGIFSTQPSNSYGSSDGTSFSAPIVSGVIALMLSVNPSLTPANIKSILTSTADKVGGYSYINGRSNELGYGRINAHAALQQLTTPITGPNSFCTSQNYTTNNPSTSWSLTLLSGATASLSGTTGSSVTVSASGSGKAILYASRSVCESTVKVSKEINYGAPLKSLLSVRGTSSIGNPNQPGDYGIRYDGQNVCGVNNKAALTNIEWQVSSSVSSMQEGSMACAMDFPVGAGQTIRFGSAGTKSIRVRARNACGWSEWTDWAAFTVNVSGSGKFNYVYYPNPANNTINVGYSNSENKIMETRSKGGKPFSVKLYDDFGKVLINNSSDEGAEIQLDVRNLTNGTYYLHITSDGETEKKQVIVNH